MANQIGITALKSIELPKDRTLKVYERSPHGILTTCADVINPDLLAFING